MDKRRCIGLIGGLGPGAAVHYYKKLAEAHAKRHVPLDLVMVHAETSRVFEYAGADDREGLARYLSSFIDRLKSAGADLAVIPAVTPHLCIRELLGLSSLPVLNLFDPLLRELSSRSVKRIGVFGTRFVMESALFGMVDGVEVVQPPQDEVEYIHRTYSELAQTGQGSETRNIEALPILRSISASGITWMRSSSAALTSHWFSMKQTFSFRISIAPRYTSKRFSIVCSRKNLSAAHKTSSSHIFILR